MMLYSRNVLLSLCFWWKVPGRLQITRQLYGNHATGPLAPHIYDALKASGILRTLRGCRGGQSRNLLYHDTSTSTSSTLQSNTDSGHSITVTTGMEQSSFGPGPLNKTNNNNSKQAPYIAKPIDFALLNTRSVRNKSLLVKDYVVDNDIDLLAMTETWLSTTDQDVQVIGDVCPTGYQLFNVPRGSRGGGVALLYKNLLKFQSQTTIKRKFKSFEFTDLLMRHSSTSLRIVIVYRPPPSKANQCSLTLFFDEFPVLLGDLVTASGSLLMAGDFNFHVDDVRDPVAMRFTHLLETFNLKQHISESTHRNGHTLDLIITRADECIASNFKVDDPVISDHYAVGCTISLSKTVFERKEIHYRKLKSIDISQFREDLASCPLLKPGCSRDLSTSVHQYDSVLTALLDKHAPLRKRVLILRPNAAWYTNEIREEKTKRRKLERRWRASQLAVDRQFFVDQCKLVNKCIVDAKVAYYSGIIADNQLDPKKLFSTVNKLLHRQSEGRLPTSDNVSTLTTAFADYFTEKISLIRDDLDTKRTSIVDSFPDSSLRCNSSFTEFKSVSPEELSKLIGPGFKSCALDPIPASILKQCIDLLLPVISGIVNCSLEHCTVSDTMKEALVKPSLKKSSLDYELLKNYRPISNLPFTAKCCEKVVAHQLNQYLDANHLGEPLQSAYKRHHSTETALIRVQNDILRAIDEDYCVMLLLLDLSAALDTVDHQILLSRLSDCFGIQGKALLWFRSYLSGRTQFVSIESERSTSRPLTCGVPQGSVLGPILYLLYTSPLGYIMRHHGVSYHLYADDTQMYLTFKSSIQGDLQEARARLEACLVDIDRWMLLNKLKLNQDKSELLVLHAKHRPSPSLDFVGVGDSNIVPSDFARNIGVVFDITFSLERHVIELCKTAFYHIRSISRIRKYLSYDTTKVLIHAFITSRLDNCNSLLYNLPKYLINRLQYVFNSAAKLVSLSRKFDHVTPLLIDLHWLPVEQRIIFKILLITYKALNGLAPSYVVDLLEPYVPRRSLRSSSKLKLTEPTFHLKSYGFRSFSICAPRLWNSIPFEIRSSSSIDNFKSKLKTHLFKQAFY